MVLHQPLIDLDGRARRTLPAPALRPDATDASITRIPTAIATRTERVQVTHISLWSVVRSAGVFWVAASAAVFAFLVLAWGVALATGLLGSVESTIAEMIGADDVTIRAAHVLGAAALLAVLFAALATIVTTVAVAVYNLGAHLIGGVELELDER
ncbi:MAG TPA: DUF3566 domain-containing protein [Acidimicrobiia bacterium]|nr:DUF3566 domain-containing protein [Acidimicrobiia bacterium]